jgi:hypothetical protein
MRQAFCCLAVSVAVFLIPPTQALVAGQGASAVQADNPTLLASLDRIARGSALWRTDLDAISRTGRRAVVLTPDAVVVVDSQSPAAPEPFGSSLAEISLIRSGDTAVDAVLVVVNLPLLDRAHNRRRSTLSEREADLDRILIHEVYGHAFPYLVTGDTSGRCPDPAPGQRAIDACSIARENAVRAELKLGRRTDYSLGSLALARPSLWSSPEGGDRRRQ